MQNCLFILLFIELLLLRRPGQPLRVHHLKHDRRHPVPVPGLRRPRTTLLCELHDNGRCLRRHLPVYVQFHLWCIYLRHAAHDRTLI